MLKLSNKTFLKKDFFQIQVALNLTDNIEILLTEKRLPKNNEDYKQRKLRRKHSYFNNKWRRGLQNEKNSHYMKRQQASVRLKHFI